MKNEKRKKRKKRKERIKSEKVIQLTQEKAKYKSTK